MGNELNEVDGKTWDGFVRQRRNLILTSVLLFFIETASTPINQLVIFENTIPIHGRRLNLLILFAVMYFAWRYGHYLRDIPQSVKLREFEEYAAKARIHLAYEHGEAQLSAAVETERVQRVKADIRRMGQDAKAGPDLEKTIADSYALLRRIARADPSGQRKELDGREFVLLTCIVDIEVRRSITRTIDGREIATLDTQAPGQQLVDVFVPEKQFRRTLRRAKWNAALETKAFTEYWLPYIAACVATLAFVMFEGHALVLWLRTSS